jgi:hypothetical protein
MDGADGLAQMSPLLEDDPRLPPLVAAKRRKPRRSACKLTLDQLVDQVAWKRLMDWRNRAWLGDSKGHRVAQFDAELERLVAEAPPQWREQFHNPATPLQHRCHCARCAAPATKGATA